MIKEKKPCLSACCYNVALNTLKKNGKVLTSNQRNNLDYFTDYSLIHLAGKRKEILSRMSSNQTDAQLEHFLVFYYKMKLWKKKLVIDNIDKNKNKKNSMLSRVMLGCFCIKR